MRNVRIILSAQGEVKKGLYCLCIRRGKERLFCLCIRLGLYCLCVRIGKEGVNCLYVRLDTAGLYCLCVRRGKEGLYCLYVRRIFTLQAYGQTFMADDRFFSVVGSAASALNSVSGMIWGWLADRYTFKVRFSPAVGMIDEHTSEFFSCNQNIPGMIWG